MFSTGPAKIALTEYTGGGLATYHFADKKGCIRAILRNRPWFDLIVGEIEEARRVWEECDAKDAESDARIVAARAARGKEEFDG